MEQESKSKGAQETVVQEETAVQEETTGIIKKQDKPKINFDKKKVVVLGIACPIEACE